MRFAAKLNKRDRPYVVADEVFLLTDGAGERYLDHDNVNEKTVEVFTEPNRGGEKVLNYTLEKRDGAEWKLWLRAFAQKEQVYVSYETLGDTVEAEDINEVQQAAATLEAELDYEKQLAQKHRADRGNPHGTTKAQVGLGNADDTPDLEKPVSVDQREAIEAVRQGAAASLSLHTERADNPHRVTKAQVGLGSADDTPDLEKPVSKAQAGAIGAVQNNLAAHEARGDNPHGVTKEQAGLGNVENVLQASKTEFDGHSGDAVRHLTAAERQSWNDKYTRNEVDNKFAALETAIDWKESVETFADIAEAYPEPVDGWTVNTKDTDYTYRYSGAEWVAISANAIPKATQSVDGLLSKEDKTAYDDTVVKKHVHENKQTLDGVTPSLIEHWNAAYAHIPDAVKHITAAERTLWNTVSDKVDAAAGKGLSSNDYTAAEKTKLAGIADNANRYVHPAYTAKASGLYKVTVDGTGHVNAVAAVAKADITGLGIPAQDTVYTHPANHPASMITGLAKVATSGSYNDLSNKPSIPTVPGTLPPSGTAGGDLSGTYPNPSVKDNSHGHTVANVAGLQTALDGKAATAHTHAIANVTGLQTALDGKAASTHAHTVANITGLQTTLDGKAPSAHTHAIANVTGLQAAIDGKAAASHTHTKSQISDFPSSLPANGGTASYANYINANTIAANTNLNNLTTPGFYFCPANATAATFTNSPTTSALFLLVGKHAGIFQMAVEYVTSSQRVFIRNQYSGTWGAWKRVLTTATGTTWNQLKGV